MIREMPVRMGRGERNYPDYCFGAVAKRGEEKASMLVEFKFEIRTQKALQEAYLQAKSYALRLQAELFIVAAKEGIWIYEQKERGFQFSEHLHFNWIDLENPDVLYRLRQIIGKR